MSYNPIPQPLTIDLDDVTAAINTAANGVTSGQCLSRGGAGSYTVQITGTFAATLNIQVTYDGVNWVNITGSYVVNNVATAASMSSANITSPGVYRISAPGIQGAQVITTSYTSGTVTGTAVLTQGTQPNTTVNATGSILALLTPQTSSGCAAYNGAVAAAATAVKTSAGQLYGWHIFNSNTSTIYVQIFNALTSGVTLGTTAPVLSIGVPAGAAVDFEQANGIAFATAISVACTTTRQGSTAPTNPVDLNLIYK